MMNIRYNGKVNKGCKKCGKRPQQNSIYVVAPNVRYRFIKGYVYEIYDLEDYNYILSLEGMEKA